MRVSSADWFKAGVARQRVDPILLGIAPRACTILSKLLLLLFLLLTDHHLPAHKIFFYLEEIKHAPRTTPLATFKLTKRTTMTTAESDSRLNRNSSCSKIEKEYTSAGRG